MPVPIQFILLREYPPEDLARRWRRCVDEASFSTHYTMPEYFHEPFIQDKRPFAVLSMVDDEIAAVCTGIHDGSSIKCGLWGRPQVAISRGVDQGTAAAGLAAGLQVEGRSASLVDVFAWLKLPGMLRWGYREHEHQGSIMLDLSPGPDVLFRKARADKRANIRKAIKSGVTVDIARSDADIESYYEVYRGWAARKGIPVQPRDVIVKAVSLASNRRLFIARHKERAVAGGIVRFARGGLVEAAANSSLREALHLKPNDLLLWREVEWACAEGFRLFSLGGTHPFLRRFGGPIAPVYRYRLEQTFWHAHSLRAFGSKLTRNVTRCFPAPVLNAVRRLRN